MKKINIYFTVFVFLATVLGGSITIFASEEATMMMCDEGVVNIGDADVDVREKCGQPDSQWMKEWVYNFGPSQPVYKVIFKDGKVVRILESQ